MTGQTTIEWYKMGVATECVSPFFFLFFLLSEGWHVYLLCTGQTTIEWYNNRMRAADARRRGQVRLESRNRSEPRQLHVN